MSVIVSVGEPNQRPNQTAVSIKKFVHQKNVHLNYLSFVSNAFTVSTTPERELLRLVTMKPLFLPNEEQKTYFFLHLRHSICGYH
jgi:hypothetical protein